MDILWGVKNWWEWHGVFLGLLHPIILIVLIFAICLLSIGRKERSHKAYWLCLIVPTLAIMISGIVTMIIWCGMMGRIYSSMSNMVHFVIVDWAVVIMAQVVLRRANIRRHTKLISYSIYAYGILDTVYLIANYMMWNSLIRYAHVPRWLELLYRGGDHLRNAAKIINNIFCCVMIIFTIVTLMKSRKRERQPQIQQPYIQQPPIQPLQPQAPLQAAPQPERPIVNTARKTSLRDEDGDSSVCSICGKPLTGFGRFGGFCTSCTEWNYDRGFYLLSREKYGPAAESLLILAAYENVHYRCQTGDYTGKLYVTPGSLIFTAGNNMRFILLFSDVTKVSATKGSTQQLTVLVQGEEYTSAYHNFDLQGNSYDGANGEDLLRICQLIQRAKDSVTV